MKLPINKHVTKTPLPITLTTAMKEIFDPLTAKGMKPLILDKAWAAQRTGTFGNRQEAFAWLDQQTSEADTE